MREMWKIRVGMRGMGWECGCVEPTWECQESRWKCKKFGNQGGDAGNQGRNLSIVMEMT